MSKKIHTRGNFLTFSPLDAFTLAQAIVQDKPFEDVVKQYGFDPKLVRAMAAVAGMPPKNGSTMLPMPCATSS